MPRPAGGLGEGIPHPAARPVREVSDLVDRLAGRSRRHEHPDHAGPGSSRFSPAVEGRPQGRPREPGDPPGAESDRDRSRAGESDQERGGEVRRLHADRGNGTSGRRDRHRDQEGTGPRRHDGQDDRRGGRQGYEPRKAEGRTQRRRQDRERGSCEPQDEEDRREGEDPGEGRDDHREGGIPGRPDDGRREEGRTADRGGDEEPGLAGREDRAADLRAGGRDGDEQRGDRRDSRGTHGRSPLLQVQVPGEMRRHAAALLKRFPAEAPRNGGVLRARPVSWSRLADRPRFGYRGSARSTAATIFAGSARRPGPSTPQARWPLSGSIACHPSERRVSRFFFTTALPSIRAFIAGAKRRFASERSARAVVVTRSFARPSARRARTSAEAGATRKASAASARAMWVIAAGASGENSSTTAASPVIARKRTGVTRRAALGVRATGTRYPFW